MMPSPRHIAAALLAVCGAMLCTAGAFAVPLDREACQTLEAERKALLTGEVRAALERGPDWVKDHLHTADKIEEVRKYLLVEEQLEFRCRTDGVVMPEPEQVPLPDRKPPVPAQRQIAGEQPTKVLAGATTPGLLPHRKPSASEEETADMSEAPEGAGDADDMAEASAGAMTAGPSQTIADSDKTAPSNIKATQ